MYILLKKGKLKQIISDCIKKAGSYNKLAKELGIYRQRVWDYKTRNVALKEEKLNLILDFIGIKLNKKDIEKELPDNWRQTIGGNNCVKKKRDNGTLNNQLAKSRGNIKKTLSDWHKKMKNENPEAYHLLQYEHFKKVGHYKLKTINNEKVRNSLEKKTANILKKLNITYQYEPLVKVGGKYFFPDFLIKESIILECTMWRGYDKAIKLKDKIRELKKEYQIYVVIPKKLEKYYQTIKKDIIFSEDLNKLLKTL